MKRVKELLIVIFSAYILIHAYILYYQRDLIYLNQQTGPLEPPKNIAQSVTFESEDGIKLSGWWVTPASTKNARALLYCHGNGATLNQLRHVAQLFYNYGVHALLFDYRGYGSSDPGELTEENVTTDARAAYDWIKNSQKFLDTQIFVWGHSLGGAIASKLVTERNPAALITEGVFSSIYDMGRYRYPYLFFSRFLLLDRFEVADNLAKRKMPLLMLHAERDTIIPLELGKQTFELAREPKQWLLLNRIDHNDFPSVEGQYREQIMKFVSTNVSPRL